MREHNLTTRCVLKPLTLVLSRIVGADQTAAELPRRSLPLAAVRLEAPRECSPDRTSCEEAVQLRPLSLRPADGRDA